MYSTLTMAASAGLLSTFHCLGMCGGIVAALALGGPRVSGARNLALALGYNGGRVASYTLLGLLASLVALPAAAAPLAYRVLQLVGFLALVLAGLRLGGWLTGAGWLERRGLRVWRHVSPLTRRFLPIDRVARAVPAGLLWGFLPCGLVYAMLPIAAGSGSAGGAALTMAAFGLGTLPGMVLASALARRLGGVKPNLALRRYAGAALVLLSAVWFALQLLGGESDHGAHAGHANHAGHTGHAGHAGHTAAPAQGGVESGGTAR